LAPRARKTITICATAQAQEVSAKGHVTGKLVISIA
jgi:hypothetical protein